jgi:predicted RNA-binding protein with PUA-like domain
MATFLFKTEPGDYSFDDLLRDKKTTWTGVSNNQALATLRQIKSGDEVIIYHTGDEKAIVGSASVIKSAHEDPDQPGKTPGGEPKFAVVDLKPGKKATTPLTLSAVKADKRFAAFALVTHSRLSVMPVPAPIEKLIRSLTGL